MMNNCAEIVNIYYKDFLIALGNTYYTIPREKT